MSLQTKQQTAYNAMMLLDSIGVTLSMPDRKGRGVIVFKGEFWDTAGTLAVRLQHRSELNRVKQTLATMQVQHAKEQTVLQDKINQLQVK